MCLLAICKSKPMPKANFDEAFRVNKDGVGFAWREGKQVGYVKGFMTVTEAWDAYKDFASNKIFPHVLHFRLGSPTVDLLTHPFEVTKDSKLRLNNLTTSNLLFHNGIITSWKDRMFEMFALRGGIPDGKIIDTRVMAILLHFYGERIFDFIDGKFAMFGPKHLKTWGDFAEDDGILYSNSSYKILTQTWNRGRSTAYNHDYGYTFDKSKHRETTSRIQIDEFIV